MQAMRRYAHKILAALLCMCLLISYTPLPASAAGAPEPSVSGSGGFTPQSDGSAQGSTTVSVLTQSNALAIIGHSDKDIVASVSEIAAGGEKYNLTVQAQGEGTLTYKWTRTVDGDLDASFSHDGAIYELAAHAKETLEDGKTYVYTVEVRDEKADKPVSMSFTVKTLSSATYGKHIFENEALGVSFEATAHGNAQPSFGALDKNSLTYATMQQHAAGYVMGNAWQIDLAVNSNDNPPLKPFINSVKVTVPVPADVTPVIFGMDSTGKITQYSPEIVDGKATFETESLGVFAVAWKSADDPAIITVTQTANGFISPSGDSKGEVKVTKGNSITFTITADEGYILDKLIVDTDETAKKDMVGDTYTFDNVQGNHTIEASFLKVEPGTELLVSASVDGEGGSVAINSPDGDTSDKVAKGSPVTFYFIPNEGFVVNVVTVTVGDAEPQEVKVVGNSYKISAVTDITKVTVSYKQGIPVPVPTYTVTASVEGDEGGYR